MTARNWLGCVILWLLLAASVFTAEPTVTEAPSTSASQPAAAYADFEFVTMDVQGVTVHVHKLLAGHKDELAKALRDYLDEEDQALPEANKLLAKADEVVARIHGLVGLTADEETITMHRKLLVFFLRDCRLGSVSRPLTLYLLGGEAVKDYLRQGHTLPGCTFNKATDKARSYSGWKMASARPDEGTDFMMPLPKDCPAEGLREALQHIRDSLLRQFIAGGALHEVAEISILTRLDPADPYFRWFSDGFANALAIHLLGEYCGPAEAKGYAAGFDISDKALLKYELNLMHWPGLAFCIKTRLPLEDEVKAARYAYATHEARRIIDAHGVGVVAKILDKACTGKPTGGGQLIAAVSEVTGEDMAQRLRFRYYSFDSLEDGLDKYRRRVTIARQDKDSAEITRALIRMHELAQQRPLMFGKVSLALSNAGLAEDADAAFAARLQASLQQDKTQAPAQWLTVFVSYALRAGRPRIAFDAAENLLQVDPNNGLALAVRTHRLYKEGLLDKAERTARRVLELGPKGENIAHDQVNQILRQIAQAKSQTRPAKPAPDPTSQLGL